MKKMVVGFMFDTKRRHVALIMKNRPDWQAGCFNGIGGKAEAGESALQAMQREFFEETGYQQLEWEHRLMMKGEGWQVNVFRTFVSPDTLNQLTSTTDEKVYIIDLRELEALYMASKTIANLRWLVPLMLDDNQFGAPVGGEILY